MTDLSNCPDFPAIRQLARALWRSGGGRGAAVLVGAGLSRTALLASGNVAPPPLWSHLAAEMAERLYPGETGEAPADPLRLAEEYRTYFGQAALDELVRTQVQDDPWTPSPTHHALLALPWADVLTTNYDTLLERAARNAERGYDPVTSEGDLAHARAPRIVKLHGSLGASERFVIAEEDYRTYPDRHAAFVNLARQTFIENELVLVGFSGDDPNFAAWTGWVRDHLGTTARRIYLAGALDLGPAKRKFLEARNISPIDLHQLVSYLEAEDRHRAAADLLLAHLASSEPVAPHRWKPSDVVGPEWQMQRDPAKATEHLRRVLASWSADRRSYPGWVTCPGDLRQTMRISVEAASLSDTALASLDEGEATRLMVELCWRHRTSLWPLLPGTIDQVQRFAALDREDLLSRPDRLMIAVVLAWQSRFDGDWDRFARMEAIVATLSSAPSDASAELAYIGAARACLDMDFATATELAGGIAGEDPFWRVRRAAILAEAGSQEEAERLVQEAVADLRERDRADRGSVWVGSRLAWSEMALRAFAQSRLESRPWTDRHQASRSDPFVEVSSMRDRILERQRDEPDTGIVPTFDPGSYADRSRTIRFRSWSSFDPFFELDLLLLDGGVPPRLEHVSLFGDERLDALRQVEDDTLAWHLHMLRTIDDSDKAFAPNFTRLKVARLPQDVVLGLVQRVEGAIEYWSRRIQRRQEPIMLADARLRLGLRTLARLAPRLDPAAAERTYRDALARVRVLRSPALSSMHAELLRNAWSAIPPERRPDLVADTLDLPLGSGSLGVEPVDWIYDTAADRVAGDARRARWVEEWIKAARADDQVRASAVLRLLHLRRAKLLTTEEDAAFADALWARSDTGDPAMPAETSVRLSFWADLPRPDGLDASEAVRARLFSATSEITDERLAEIRGATDLGMAQPDAAQASAVLDRLCAEDPPSVDGTDPIARIKANFAGYDRRHRRRLLSHAIAAIAEKLDPADLTEGRANAITGFIDRTQGVAAASALSRLPHRPGEPDEAATFIRRGLRARASETVADAVSAMLRWQRRVADDDVPGSFHALVEAVVSSIEVRRPHAVPHVLRAAVGLSKAGLTSRDQEDRLVAGLQEMSAEWAYADVEDGSEEAGTVSLVRAECVRLASVLLGRGHASAALEGWRDAAASDPLPEVRFAADEGE